MFITSRIPIINRYSFILLSAVIQLCSSITINSINLPNVEILYITFFEVLLCHKIMT